MSFKFTYTTPKSMLDYSDGQSRTVTYEIDNCEGATVSELCQDFQRFLSSCGYCFALEDSIECLRCDDSDGDSEELFGDHYDPVDDPVFDDPNTGDETPTETQLELDLNTPSEEKPNV